MDRFQERTTFEETEQLENEVTESMLVAQDAEELAVFGPRCSVRDALIVASDTIATMRVLLRSHEAECVHCGCTKKTVVSDRLMVTADAVCCERLVA
jgi:adenine/guanine phosphoribosyltransferase-like PRPP-binding protein